MEHIDLEGYRLSLQKGKSPLLIVVVGFKEEIESLAASFPDVSFLGVEPKDWDGELTPWPSQRIFSSRDHFAGKANDFLSFLLQEAIPFAQKEIGSLPLAIGGYSLAGLFSIYALYESDVFQYAFSCSGSFWYPKFREFAHTHALKSNIEAIYISLGDAEKKAKNKTLATVEEATGDLVDLLIGKGFETKYVLNPGNHFNDPSGRMALAIDYLLGKAK